MSRFEIKMPKLGESITEGTIISWSVKVGDTVQEDDVLFEVNTAKVSAEIPSPVEGKVIGILFKEGDTVPVGTVVAIVDIDSDEGIGEALVEERNVPQAEETSSHVPSVTSVQEVKEVPKAIAAKTEEERWYSPIVLQLAQAAHISKEELDRIQGTGYEGRLSKKDIKAYITRKEQGNITVTEPVSASAQSVVDCFCPDFSNCAIIGFLFNTPSFRFARRRGSERDGSCPENDCRSHGYV